MNESPKVKKLWTGKFIIGVLMGLALFMCSQSLVAGVPAYITDVKNNPAQGGLMTTVFMIAAIITRPIIGYLIPKVNIKILNIATLIFLAVTIALSYGQDSVGYLLLLRVLHGIAFGVLSTTIATMATNVIPSNRMGEGISYYGLATSSGASFAPMIALAILQSISYNFLIAVSVSLVILTLVLTIMAKGNKVQKAPLNMNQTNKEKVTLKEYAFDKKALLPSGLICLYAITYSGIMSFLMQLGAEANIEETVSSFFLVMTIVSMVTIPTSGFLYDRIGHRRIIYLGVILGIIGLTLLANTHSITTLLIAALFYGAANGFLVTTIQTITISSLNKEKQGTANAMFYSFFDIGMAVGSTGLGVIAGIFGYHFIYGFSTVFFVVLLLVYAFTFGKRQSIHRLKKAS